MASIEKKLLPRCSGRLSIEEATDGMNAAIDNAKRLASDAELLLQNGRTATALSISILAIEEAGKVSIIRSLLASNDDQLKSHWKRYRDHKAKNVAWILPDLVSRGARTLHGLREAADNEAEHAVVLEILKQLGLYTDFIGQRNWSKPADAIDEDLAESLLKVAWIMTKSRSITIEENEIWVKHLGPKSEHGMTKAGLSLFLSEASQKGIIQTDNETAQKFIFGDVTIVEK